MSAKSILLVCMFLMTYGYPGVGRADSEPKAPVIVEQSSEESASFPMLYAQIPEQYAREQEPYDRDREQNAQPREQYARALEEPARAPDPYAQPQEQWAQPQEQLALSPEQSAQPASALSEPATPVKANPPKGIFTMHLKHPGDESRFEMSFADVPEGSEIANNHSYEGWCVQRTKYIRKNADHEVRLFAIDDPNMPPAGQGLDWNEINYVLNHKEGKSSDVQQAIWHITDGRKQLSKEAASMVRNAKENGRDYVPASGETTAVVCDSGPHLQQTILEYNLPVVESVAAPAPIVLAETPTPVPEPTSRKWPFIPPIPIPIPPGDDDDNNPNPIPVPEPDTLTLSVIGLMTLGIVVLARRRQGLER